jgi:hypothetical protein
LASLSPAHRPGCARLGIARLNAFRLDVYEVTTPVYINGAPIAAGPGVGLFIEGASIQHILNDQVDTARFTARGWTPVAGQRIDVYSGEVRPDRQLFGGRILETTARYLSKAATPNVVTDIQCIDPTWLLSRTKVLATYTGQSATAVILDLMARFTRGFTVAHVQAGLPTIDAITFTNEDVPTCLTQICQRVGAYWYVDYVGDLHVFTVADQAATPMTQANAGDSGDHQLSEDLSQVATRIIGLGGGVSASVDLPPGAPELPVDLGFGADQVQWYPGAGGLVQVGTQRATYTQVRGTSGRGAILGTGNAPTVAPTLAPAPGTGLAPGTYQWAVTFKTAAGETLLGPAAVAATGDPAPTLSAVNVRPGVQQANPARYTPNANLMWRVSVLYAGSTYSLGPASGPWNVGDRIPEVGVGPIAVDPVTGHEYNTALQSRCPAKIIQTTIYRSANNGATVYAWQFWDGPIPTPDGWITVGGNVNEVDLGSQPQYPTGPVATFNAITVTLPKSSSPTVNGRSLFRTAVNGAALRRLTTIADNTTATYLDQNPDSALIAGAAGDPPAHDTSLLREDGQILPGATEVIVTDITPFLDDGGAGGGWAQLGNLTIRYGGIELSSTPGTPDMLVWVPATGAGSITATVRYGTEIIVQPRLVGIPASGVGALTFGVRKGDTVTLRMELEDIAAAQALAERMQLSGYFDGLVDIVVSDSRFGPTELRAQMQATLLERKDPRLTLTYWTRDLSHEVGRLVTVNLTTPPINGTFRIQRVTFSEISIAGAGTTIRPKRTIEATNKLYTFTDILRRLRGREGGVP